MIGSMPVCAMEEKPDSAALVVKEKKKETILGRAQKQFNESLDRFYRCVQLKCTPWEALKAARDLGIAAATVIAVMYVTGEAFKQLAGPIMPGLYGVGEGLQAPVTLARSVISGSGTERAGGTFEKLSSRLLNKKAMYRNSPGYVSRIFSDGGTIYLELTMEKSGESISVPLDELGYTLTVFKEDPQRALLKEFPIGTVLWRIGDEPEDIFHVKDIKKTTGGMKIFYGSQKDINPADWQSMSPARVRDIVTTPAERLELEKIQREIEERSEAASLARESVNGA